MKEYFKFKTTYDLLPDIFYDYTELKGYKNPEIVLYNLHYAKNLELGDMDMKEAAEIFSGNKIIEGTRPFSKAYAGHQYGYFTMLGDGRNVLLGEHSIGDEKIDIELKGSGRTLYSRRGDGKATLSPMLREYIISEAMYHLGIETTRSLAVLKTGEKIQRMKVEDGAVLVRTAKSHIRIGTFEYAFHYGTKEDLKALMDYVIERHYKKVKEEDDIYLSLFYEIYKKQLALVNEWLRVGFVHGVMNTDNTSIPGETIDYGPCAFMDTYDEKTVFSSIDQYGRYAFSNQPHIIKWNLERLLECFIPFTEEEKLKEIVDHFITDFNEQWIDMMRKKLGLYSKGPEDLPLIKNILVVMKKSKYDYTSTFIYLRHFLKPLEVGSLLEENDDLKVFLDDYKRIIEHRKMDIGKMIETMEKVNPIVIPRNHIVEESLQAAEAGDLSKIKKLLVVLSKPYDYSMTNRYYLLPSEDKTPYITYCGT